MIQNRSKIGNGVIVLIAIFLLGYAMIMFSMLFGKSTEYTAVIETEVSELQFTIQFMEKQLQEKQSIIDNLSKNSDNKNTVSDRQIPVAFPDRNPNDKIVRPGVIVLGMHRSGTSVIGGLMSKMGLETGGPLIQAAEDNEKGFFERIDVVLQNDALFKKQSVHYSLNTHKYDAQAGVRDILTDDGRGPFFREGAKGLKFLNNPRNSPWMLKDPRLCITVRTWLPLLSAIPAVLFTYRHPLDVARSLNSRENEQFKISKGLRMWYVYNRRAVEQSHDLCRVVTSHRAVMQQPGPELDRVYTELRQCGVAVPRKLSAADIGGFIDVKLQHGRSALRDTSCGEDLSTLRPPQEVWPTTEPEHLSLYREAMRVYCALEDRSALSPSFPWDMSIKDN